MVHTFVFMEYNEIKETRLLLVTLLLSQKCCYEVKENRQVVISSTGTAV